jgi:hypothetical protein
MAHYGPRFGSRDKYGKPKRDWAAVADSRRINKLMDKAENAKKGTKGN